MSSAHAGMELGKEVWSCSIHFECWIVLSRSWIQNSDTWVLKPFAWWWINSSGHWILKFRHEITTFFIDCTFWLILSWPWHWFDLCEHGSCSRLRPYSVLGCLTDLWGIAVLSRSRNRPISWWLLLQKHLRVGLPCDTETDSFVWGLMWEFRFDIILSWWRTSIYY